MFITKNLHHLEKYKDKIKSFFLKMLITLQNSFVVLSKAQATLPGVNFR